MEAEHFEFSIGFVGSDYILAT